VEWDEAVGAGPIVALAVHEGHEVRPSLLPRFAITPEERRREEDPGTGSWAALAPTFLIARRSRFEVDLNRPPERAVYRTPGEAWGLAVWREEPPAAELAASRALHARFFARLGEILDRKVAEEGGFVLLDLHSYNHRRDGRDAPPADPAANPEVNLGTGTLDRARWGALVDRCLADLRTQRSIPGLDVRENVKFRGGWVAQWTNARHRERGVALAIEFKKTYLDEWSGVIDPERAERLGGALCASFPGLEESLRARLAPPAGSRGR
jgi:N-formylglutamate amidohydrolase